MSDILLPLTTDAINLYAVLFDMLIIIAIGGLWLMWARNLSRQKNVETMLSTTSNQLEEASRHLESALKEIQQLQQRNSDPTLKTEARLSKYNTDIPDIASSSSPPDNDSDVQKILRMHRLGQQAEQIASQLDLPLARVKLLLHLNEQRPL
ncbi:MAG: hypothetical protein Q9M25_01795 [Mariprofundaceae bacterium]|nr:hypothetical protein [Mariprofundaceae bacterium]